MEHPCHGRIFPRIAIYEASIAEPAMTDDQHQTGNPAPDGVRQSEVIRQDNERQIDPELAMAEGRATPGRIAITAVAAIAILGIFFYGISHQRPETAEPVTATESGSAATPQPGGQADAKARGQNQQDANTGSSTPAPQGDKGSNATSGGAPK
jgi:hypothetical protein